MLNNIQNLKIGLLFKIEKGDLQSLKNEPGDYDFITASQEWKKHKTFSHDCEALIFAMGASGSLGRTHYVNGKFISSDLCFILTPKDEYKGKINLKFYHIYFTLIRDKIVSSLAKGAAKKAINKKDFSKYEVIFVGKEDQDMVVERLGRVISLSEQLEGCLEVIKSNSKEYMDLVLDDVFNKNQ